MRTAFSCPPWTVVPADGEFVIPIDSTWIGQQTTVSIATGNAFLVPGPHRGLLEKAVISWEAQCTTNNCTMNEQELTGVAGTAADWTTTAAHTITAGADPYENEFTPAVADWRLQLTCVTEPGSVIIRVMVHFTNDRGS